MWVTDAVFNLMFYNFYISEKYELFFCLFHQSRRDASLPVDGSQDLHWAVCCLFCLMKLTWLTLICFDFVDELMKINKENNEWSSW